MKKFPKLLQADARGQIVIPKEIRRELGIDEGTGFFAFCIGKEGIFLKKVEAKPLSEQPEIRELREKAKAVPVDPKHIDAAEKQYAQRKRGGLEEL